MAALSKSKLDNFLRKHKRKGDESYTHTALPNLPESFAGSYVIPPEKYDEFLKLYHDSVFINGNNAYLTERHLDFCSLLIDLDFRFPFPLEKRVYDSDFIEKFLKIYMKHVSEIVDCVDTEIFVLEKSEPKPNPDKKIVKDGIHIMIPGIVTIPKIQYVLRYRVIQDPETKALMDTIKPTNDLQDIIDLCVIERNNWQMYGSMKPKNEPYLVKHIFNFNSSDCSLDELEIEDNYNSFELLTKLSLRNIEPNQINEIKEDAYEGLDRDYELMGGNYKMTKTRLKKSSKSNKKAKKNTIQLNNFEENTNEQETKELEKISKLVNILNPERAENYNTWIQLGWCLHNVDYRLLSAWVDFSQKSPKYEDGVCEVEWENMDSSGLGLGTLYMWCKQDNPVLYKALTSNDLNNLIIRSLTGSHNDIAKVMHNMFRDEFIYGTSKTWYQFKNHRWVNIGDGIPLRQKISNQLLNEYLRFSTKLTNETQSLDFDDPQRHIKIDQSEKLGKVMAKLKTNSFKKSLIDECIEMFYNDEFEELLDTRVNLIGFENGVYDLDNELFREGIPDDYITFSTGINYEEFEYDDEAIIQINTFLQQILQKKDQREYVLTFLASCLDGRIIDEKFPIWTGTGGNGKSKLLELYCKSFGDYTGVLPISMITQKRARSEACDPNLVQAKGKRFCYFQEPDDGDKINVGLMKELTGGDKVKARGLYSKPIEFKPQFKLCLACNELPEMGNGLDQGVWRRTRVVDFASKFRDNPDPRDPNQFKIDHHLSEKFDNWMEPFMYMLLQYYKIYKIQGLKEPESVKLSTQNYQNDSDIFSQFFTEKIEIVDGSIIHIDIAHSKFKDWFNISIGQGKIPSRKEFKKNMILKYGKSDKEGNIFKGLDWLPEKEPVFIQDDYPDEEEVSEEEESDGENDI
jgi:P4 family phage/plasmid primase-like protien